MEDSTKRNGALALAALAVVAGVYYWQTGSGKNVTCALTSAAVSIVVADVTHGKGTSEIVGTTAAGILVPAACESMIDSLIHKPASNVSFKLTLPNGATQAQDIPGTAVLAPPPATVPSQTPVDRQTAARCLNYPSDFLFSLCLDGAIGPP